MPRFSVMKTHKLGSLIQHKIYLLIWRPEVEDQGIGRVMLSLKSLGETLSLLLPSFWWLLTTLDVPWFVAVTSISVSLSQGLFI